MLDIKIKWSKDFSYNEENSRYTGELRIYLPEDENAYIQREFRSPLELQGEALADYWGSRCDGYRYQQIHMRNDNLDILRDMIDEELIKGINLICEIVKSNRQRRHDAEVGSCNDTVSL